MLKKIINAKLIHKSREKEHFIAGTGKNKNKRNTFTAFYISAQNSHYFLNQPFVNWCNSPFRNVIACECDIKTSNEK